MIDQFLPSALINTGIFWWMASLVLVVRIFILYGQKMSLALLMGTCLGPLALLYPLIGGHHAKKFPWKKSFLAIFVGAILVGGLFYIIFVSNFPIINSS